MHILLIEDHKSLTLAITAMLSAHTVHHAGTFVAATDALANVRPKFDFVVSDIMFPGKFITDPPEPLGLEIAELCQEMAIPFLLMTGSESLFDQAIDRHYCVLRKPFGMDTLLDVVEMEG